MYNESLVQVGRAQREREGGVSLMDVTSSGSRWRKFSVNHGLPRLEKEFRGVFKVIEAEHHACPGSEHHEFPCQAVRIGVPQGSQGLCGNLDQPLPLISTLPLHGMVVACDLRRSVDELAAPEVRRLTVAHE